MRTPTKQVTALEAVKILDTLLEQGLTGCEIVHIKAETEPDINLTNKETGAKLPYPKDQIVKVSEYGCGFGYEYDKSVENRLLKENKEALDAGTITKEEVLAKFERGTSWHVPVAWSKVVHANPKSGELYLYYQCNTANVPKVQYINVTTGKEIPVEELTPFLRKSSKPTNQGTEKAINARTLKLCNLKCLSAGNDTYEII